MSFWLGVFILTYKYPLRFEKILSLKKKALIELSENK